MTDFHNNHLDIVDDCSLCLQGVLTRLRSENNELRKKRQAIADAWNIPGPGSRPTFHEANKIKLMQEWPTLYKAILDL